MDKLCGFFLVKIEEYIVLIQIIEEIAEIKIYKTLILSQISGYFSQILNGWTAKDIIILSEV